ncbi:MAG: D-alanine--D-alanine ligase [Phycisphaerae bacterium]|nr:D-alanine--D-alanine ligase [Phycisphaerae bacterium]
MSTPDVPQPKRKLEITVLAGGPSAEREVSLDSGRAIAGALASRGHTVHLADIGPDDLSALDHPADVVFPALHGTFGEDGTLQRILEKRGLKFVGSCADACALSIDKVRTKQAVKALKLNVAPDIIVTREHLEDAIAKLSVPVVVKPIDQGSSVQTYVVHDAEKLEPSIRAAVGHFGRAMVEQFIAGDELTVGIVGHEALPPICIRATDGFYDYNAKYIANTTEYLFDAGHSAGLLSEARLLSQQVFRRLGCRHLARVDWIVDPDGQLWFLELNALPGFTSHSLVPKAAAHEGVSFEGLVERLVWMAMEDTP